MTKTKTILPFYLVQGPRLLVSYVVFWWSENQRIEVVFLNTEYKRRKLHLQGLFMFNCVGLFLIHLQYTPAAFKAFFPKQFALSILMSVDFNL